MKWPKLPCITLITIAILFGAVLMASAGTVPTTLNYQGTLYDNTGQAVNGPKDIAVSLYDVSSGGTAFWTELQTGVIVKDGNFSVVLGKDPSRPIDQTKLSGITFIGVKVGTDTEMVPRQQFTSVAYAMKSGDGVPIGVIVMWSGATVPQGWALCDGIERTLSDGTKIIPPDLRDRFIVGIGSSYAAGPGAKSVTDYTINLQHSHTVNDHTHAVEMDTVLNHQHTGITGNNSGAKQRQDDNSIYWSAAEPHTHSFTTDPAGSHKHNAWTLGASDNNTNSRLSTAQDIRPPYYALAFIMKLQ